MKLVGNGIAKIAAWSGSYRGQPKSIHAKRLDRFELRRHIGVAALPKAKWLNTIDHGPVDPAGMLAGKIDCLGAPLAHPKHGGALVGATNGIGDSQRYKILALDGRRRQHDLATSCGKARQRPRVRSRSN